ncbi:patellin-3 isoform X2 [Lolium perenne]|uniref:patellin-3 isoform X2 n=1 Tax=Lolium perenne TaxID=4522 RepID=UPI0021F6962D|nr:patellin-3-like isoform X2 [Lolium perenne]
MAEETQPQAAAAAPAAEAAPEVVVAAEKAPAEVEKKAEEPAAEAETEESAAVADDGGAVEATGSFKEESNLVADLPDPEKKALDEFKELIVAALAAGEFNLPPPPPPPKAKAEEPAKAEEAKTEEPAKQEPKAEEPKAEVVAEAAAAAEPAKEEPKAEDAKPAEPKTEEAAAEEVTKPAETAAAATPEDTPAPEAEADAVAPPEPVFIWGVPLVGNDERTDAVLLKFLRAREFKVKEAMAMLRSAVLWRKRFGIDALLEADLAFPELEKVVFYRGADRECHPVCYNVYGEFQDKDLYEKAFGDEEKRERFLKWRIQLLERGILSQLDFAPSGICSMVQVTDLKNSPPMLGKHRAVTRQAVALLQDNYPEFIAKKVFINVPWWYLAANKMMSPFLTQRTRSKFVFASQAKSPETLFRYIAPEQVPVQFGGLFKEDDPEFTTADSVTELTIKASSKETIEIPVTENSTIVWELRVLGWEVSYGAEFTPAAEGGYTVIVQKTRKVPANEEPIMKGSFKVTEAGKIALTINNPASKKKKLLYRSKVKSTSESV